MDSPPLQGRCSDLCVDERIELVHALLKRKKKREEASELLQSWSRRDILKTLRAMGEERKYSALSKSKLVEDLLGLLSGGPNRKQKPDSPESVRCCDNSACRAILGWEGEFCKRCSCCVCLKYDDNKDPSLWLTCGSELLSEGEGGCGLSCHLECILDHDNSGIGRDVGERGRLDGRFYCVSCGKENDLIRCWRKQMTVAKETRRVDTLSYRVYLGQKLLRGTTKYQEQSSFMDQAVKKLEVDVGPLPLKTVARGIVNRLSSGPYVQELCSSALASLDKNSAPLGGGGACVDIRVQDIQTRSITFSFDSCDSSSSSSPTGIRGFRLFCRKTMDQLYLPQPTCVVYLPDMKTTITGLDPATNFSLKVVAFNSSGDDDGASELQFSTLGEGDEASNHRISERSQSPLTNSSSLSNPSSVDDVLNKVAVGRRSKMVKACNAGESDLGEGALLVDQSKDTNRHGKRVQTESGLPVTPCKTDTQGKKKRTKRSKSDTETGPTMTEEYEKGSTTIKIKGYTDNGEPDKEMEHIVNMIRCLEQEGHVDKSFRERFLPWYSLRATHREVRTVKLFVETFKEDLVSLGEQLVDTFSECLPSNRSTAVVPAGICLKLWH